MKKKWGPKTLEHAALTKKPPMDFMGFRELIYDSDWLVNITEKFTTAYDTCNIL